jgi:hypothetical protein
LKTSELRRSTPGSTGLAVITMVVLSGSIFGGSCGASPLCCAQAAKLRRTAMSRGFHGVLRIWKS